MDDLDHRSLGTRLDLWHIQEDAPGMVFWHLRGNTPYRILEDYICRKMHRLGYAEVRTPQLLPRGLWIQSGHSDLLAVSCAHSTANHVQDLARRAALAAAGVHPREGC
jgi:threonyl-tRNA synthetase